jgi:predicted DNA-binding transcriptional regulator AlpA
MLDLTSTPLYLTESQLAAHLGMARITLAQWRSKGFGPPFMRVGRSIRYRLTDVNKWAEANLTSAGQAA